MPELRRAPSPRGGLVFGSLRAFRSDPIGLLMAARRDHGDVVRLRLGRITAHLVSHPQGIRHVLQTRHLHYTKRTRGIARLREILGDGLLTNDGEFWLRQRRTMQPAFHRERIQGFGALMARAVSCMLDDWERRSGSGPLQLDVAREMMALTLRIVAEALFGADVEPVAGDVDQALGTALHVTNDRVKQPFDLPSWLPTPGNRRFRSAMAVLDGVVEAMIRQRRRGEARDDLLSMLMQARDPETGQGMSDRQLRDEVMGVFLAGHETTANALTWTLYLLSQHPDAEAELHAELARVLGGRVPTHEDARQLPYAAMVIQESMRLFPPAWLFGRSPAADEEIEGFGIPKGSLVFLSPYVTHRHPELWPEPERVSPRRFAPEQAATLDRFAYFPFGGGPRLCIGAPFAKLEMLIVLASVVQRFQLRLAQGAVVEPEPLVTLRPRHGMPMLVEPRLPPKTAQHRGAD